MPAYIYSYMCVCVCVFVCVCVREREREREYSVLDLYTTFSHTHKDINARGLKIFMHEAFSY
jgi:hypothetical protein